MLFPEICPSRDACYEAVANALQDGQGLLYLDASLLIHCYEMNAVARDDLLDALESLTERVAVPLWAAKETWEYVRKNQGKQRHPFASGYDTLRERLRGFQEEVRRYVDDDTVPELTRDQFVAELEAASGTLLEVTGRVARFEPKVDQTSARLLPFLESHRLSSDLVPILRVVQETAELRYQHDVPPGQGDGGSARDTGPTAEAPTSTTKKGKDRNRYGDLIIWHEILADCDRRKAQHLVLATRDTAKGDWVFAPAKVLDDKGRPQVNAGAVTLPLPLLVHEAKSACPSLQTVNIVSLEMLAQVMQRNLRFTIPHLVAALQERDTQRKPKQARSEEGREEEPTPPSDKAETLAEPAVLASSDMDYEPSGNDPFNEQLRALRAADWGVQNEAVAKLERLVPSSSRDQLVQLGRGLVVASISGAVEASASLGRLLSSPTAGRLRRQLLLGALAEVYLSETGEPKKPAAPLPITGLIFGNGGDEELQDAYREVLDRIVPQRRTYLALPTEADEPINLTVELEGTELRNITTNGARLIEEQAPPARLMRRGQRETSITVEELLHELATEFVVPRDRLRADVPTTQRVEVPQSSGYVAWGPSTGVYLR